MGMEVEMIVRWDESGGRGAGKARARVEGVEGQDKGGGGGGIENGWEDGIWDYD